MGERALLDQSTRTPIQDKREGPPPDALAAVVVKQFFWSLRRPSHGVTAG